MNTKIVTRRNFLKQSLVWLAGAGLLALRGEPMTHTMDEGSGWTQQTGTWTISSNTAVQALFAGALYVVTTDVGKANCKIHARIKKLAPSGVGFGGVVVRFTDINNYFIVDCDWDGGRFQIVEIHGGTQTTRSTKSWTKRFSKWIEIDITCSGNDISATADGGYGITYNSSANNTATKFGLVEYRDGTYAANAFDDFQAVDLPVYPWTRQGTVLSAGADDVSNVYEPSVIYDSNAQILSGNVFKMWHTGGWATPHIDYAESVDGVNWTKYASNPVLAGINCSSVLKVGSTYYLYGHDGVNQRINRYTSSDGLTWTLANAGVIVRGAAGQWDDWAIGNNCVWYEGTDDWRMIYEASRIDGLWKGGYATSPDGISWTKSASNPVLVHTDGSGGNPSVIKVGSYYYCFMSQSPATVLPTFIARYRSSDLVTWEAYPFMVIMPRVGTDEGENSYVGQAADPNVLIVGNTAYLYFAASSDGSASTGAFHIVLATADSRAVERY